MNKTHASTPTGDRLRVVVCGASLFIDAVAESLHPLPEVHVYQIIHRFPTSIAYIVDMAPDVVIIDRADDNAGLIRALLKHDLPLIEVDAHENAVTLLSGRRVPISETGDLVRLINENKRLAPKSLKNL